MMCGLQGSGKTTTCGKLAAYLKKRGRSVMLAAADLQRPAAVEQLETVARQVLSGMVQFWDAPRFIRVVGDDGAFDAKMLSQSDLKNGTDIFVEHESMLPKSKSAKIATIEGWVDKGIILPEQALEAMEMGTLGNVYKRIRLDRDSARRENVTLASMDPALVQQHYQQFQQQAQVASAEQGVMAAASGGAPVDPMMAAAPVRPPALDRKSVV